MDAILDPDIEEVVVMSCARIGKTEVLLNAIGYFIEHDPSPILVVQPRIQDATEFAKDRINPMVRDCGVLKPLVKSQTDTLLHKAYPGGRLMLTSSGSASGLSGRTVRIVLLDEVDQYEHSVEGQGDPVSLARKRAFSYRSAKKFILTSTPTIKGRSRIEAAYNNTDQRKFHVPCHHCGFEQVLIKGDPEHGPLMWDEDKETGEHLPDTARYKCVSCDGFWTDGERLVNIRSGRWIATTKAKAKGSAGFHLNELYSPNTTLADFVARWVVAKQMPETLKSFVNLSLGETIEEVGERVDHNELMDRREAYTPQSIPNDVVFLVAGIDTQDDRLAVEIVGFGLNDGETWNIEYKEIYGNVANPYVFNELEMYLRTAFKRQDGRLLYVRHACIDSGGHYTQQVYQYAKMRRTYWLNVWAIKGMPGAGRPIVDQKRSKDVFLVGVYNAKSTLYSNLTIEKPGPGYCHFPIERDVDYFLMLTAEEKRVKHNKGYQYTQYEKIRARNEALDCRVYAMAAYHLSHVNLIAVNTNLLASPAPTAELNTTEVITAPEPKAEVPVASRSTVRGPYPAFPKKNGVYGKYGFNKSTRRF